MTAIGTPDVDMSQGVTLFETAAGEQWRALATIPMSAFLAAGHPEAAVSLMLRELFVLTSGAPPPEWRVIVPKVGSNGFVIEIASAGSLQAVQVMFGRLEERFEHLDGALRWVERALSDSYCLRTTVVGGREREWFLEPRQPDVNAPVLAAGEPVLLRSLRRAVTIVRSNSFSEASAMRGVGPEEGLLEAG